MLELLPEASKQTPPVYQQTANTIAVPLVHSRLDYFGGLPDCQLTRLQHVHNVAARIVTRSKKYVHTTPILKDLHWLPVKLWIDFKLLSVIYYYDCYIY